MKSGKLTPFSSEQDIALVHKNAIELIELLQRPGTGVIKSQNWLNEQQATLCYESGKYMIYFRHHISKESFNAISPGKEMKKLMLRIGRSQIVLHDVFLTEYTPPQFKGFIPQFQTRGFPTKRPCFHRMIIPLSKDLKLFHILETATFSSDVVGWSRSAVTAKIDDLTLVASIIKHNSRRYLFIDGLSKSGFEYFEDRAHSVKNALGYLTGYLPGNEAYFISSSIRNKKEIRHFRYSAIRPEIKVFYTPLNANPFAWTRQRPIAERIQKQKLLRELKLSEFSKFCCSLNRDNELTSVILSILESLSTSLIIMPRNLAIALEMIADIVVNEKKEPRNPVSNKQIARQIKNECIAVLGKYKEDLSEEAIKILTNKFNGLNQVTNQSRLKAPFIALGIELSIEESEAIETRNAFLHGRIPDITNAGPNRSMARLNADCMYAAMRLYTLLNMVILKTSGYDNYVLNHAKIQEEACGMKLKEFPYRRI